MIAQHLEKRRFFRKWLWLWLGLPALMFALAVASYGSDFGFFLSLAIIPLFLIWGGVALYCGLWSLQLAFNGFYVRCLLVLLVPASFLFNLMGSEPGLFDAARYARFLVSKPFFDAQVAQLPDNGLRMKMFEWMPGWDIDDVVVYDESGQIALPAKRRSKSWWQHAYGAEMDTLCDDSVQRLWDHYYFAERPC